MSKQVTLIHLDKAELPDDVGPLTPYKYGEIFTVDEDTAEKLLKPDHRKNDFGEVYPVVKVRKFNPKKDAEALLKSKTLNQRAHAELQLELDPDNEEAKATLVRLDADEERLKEGELVKAQKTLEKHGLVAVRASDVKKPKASDKEDKK